MIRTLLETYIRDRVPEDTVAVLLSGGVDSLSLAFCADGLGKRVHAYTFSVEGIPSKDSDKAMEASRTFGWDATHCIVPVSNIRSDWKTLADKYDCGRKIEFECTWPFLYVYPQITEKHVFSGLGADQSYGLSKESMMHHLVSKEAFDADRRRKHKKNPGSYPQHLMLAKEYSKEYHIPYIQDNIREYFLGLTWEEIHTPCQKGVVVDDFREYFDRLGKWGKHSNLQLDAEIDHVFEKLVLPDEQLNFKKRRRIMDVARDWKLKMETNALFAD